MAGRSFSDEEVARILARAAELQQVRDERGTGLDEIERAAAEAGIDPAMVRAAATEMDGVPSAAPAQKRGFFGPTRVVLQATVDGEVAQDDFARLSELFHHLIQLPVTTSQVGRTLQWSFASPQGGRTLFASVAVRDGQTTVRFHEALGTLMGVVYGAVGGGVGGGVLVPGLAIGAAVLLGPLGGVLGGLIGAAASFFGSRALYLAAAGQKEKQVAKAFDSLVNEVRTLAKPVAGAAPDAAREAAPLDEARARQGLSAAPQREAEQQAQRDAHSVDVAALAEATRRR